MPLGGLAGVEDGLEVALDQVRDGDRLALGEAALGGDGEDLPRRCRWVLSRSGAGGLGGEEGAVGGSGVARGAAQQRTRRARGW